MKQKPLAELGLAELQTKEKALKTAVTVMGVFLAIMILICAYLTFLQGFSVFTVLPVAFLPLFMVNIANLKKIKAEIASRVM
ncbi:MAG: hypothetical protein MUD08_18665 [Cytophagales bacterium]|jgi:hypothetical protein|nr:hypothetical protein [Cytophagales bacterium]